MKIQVSYRAIILLIVLLSNSIEGFPQKENYYLKNYTVDHGLPNNHVRSIAQDQYGFIWIATWDAVSRYDGYEFINYYHNPQDSLSGPGTDILRLVIDGENIVWVCNPFGIYKFDRTSNNFKSYREVKSQIIYDIACDRNNNCWLTSNKGLYKYSNSKDKFEFYPIINTYQDSTVFFGSTNFDRENNLWIYNGTYFHIFKNDTIKKELQLSENLRSIQNESLNHPNFKHSFQIFNSGNLRIVTSSFGLFSIEKNTKKITDTHYPSILNNEPTPYLLWWNDPENGFFLKQGDFNFHLEKENSRIQSCFVDRNQTIWLGEVNNNSEGIGVIKINHHDKSFRHFLTLSDLGYHVSILSILKSLNGTMWVGTIDNNFIYKIEEKKQPVKCLYTEKIPGQIMTHSRSLMFHNGMVYAGSFYEPFYRFNPSENIVELLCPGPLRNLIPEKYDGFKLLINDKFNNLVIAGRRGICVLDPQLDKILFYNEFIEGDVFAAFNDSDSNYWFGRNGFLLAFDKNFKNERIYSVAEKKYNVESIIEADSSHLWLALLGGGICLFDKRDGSYNIYSTQHGLKNSTSYNLLKDKHGHIWVSTNQGISMFNPETKRFRNFGEAEGLQIVEFNADAVWHGEDDEMMFGGMGGFVSFYPDSVENMTNDYYAPLMITELKVSGTTYFPNVYELQKVELGKGMDNFQLAFACLDYQNADKLLYRYRLLENDTGWILTDSRNRHANYINLEPGIYHFKLQATDINGNWKKEAALEIEIPPYYYQTLLFKIVAAAFIFGLISLIIYQVFSYYRLKEKKERELLMHREEAKREHLKMEALRGQLNPHFIFNSLNSVNDFILDNDPLRANQYLTDFSSLMRAFLDNSKNEFIPLIKEIELLEHYLKLEQTRFSDKFRYEIDTDQIENIYVEITPSMIQPFVENAVWHGIGKLQNNKPGIIKLLFKSCDRKCVICQVEDNGIGVEKANAMKSHQQKKRQSRGTGIIKERLDIYNGMHNTNFTIRFEEIDPGIENPGTRAIIEIPIKESELPSESPRKSEGLQSG